MTSHTYVVFNEEYLKSFYQILEDKLNLDFDDIVSVHLTAVEVGVDFAIKVVLKGDVE